MIPVVDGCYPPRALSDVPKLQAIFEVLRRSDAELRALGHGNWLRVLGDTWTT